MYKPVNRFVYKDCNNLWITFRVEKSLVYPQFRTQCSQTYQHDVGLCYQREFNALVTFSTAHCNPNNHNHNLFI